MAFGLRRLALLVFVSAAFQVTTHASASQRCEELQSRLASLPRTVVSGAEARSYSSAISRQNIELRKARTDLRRLGCGGGSITTYGNANAGECDAIATTVDQMERNLQILVKKRDEIAIAGGDQGARGELLDELSSSGCEEAAAVDVSATADLSPADTALGSPRPDSGQQQPNLPTTFSNRAADWSPDWEQDQGEDWGSDRWGSERWGGNSGAPVPGEPMRTVCVRTCDGGFFPISSAASPMDFRRDQRACAMMCPQTETELYYQPLQSLDSGEMISTVTGEPYSTLPTAYAYQTRDLSKDKSCGCDLAAYYRKVTGAGAQKDTGTGAGATRTDEGSITTIRIHPVDSVSAPGTVAKERPYDPEKDRVRTVGPVFLPNDQPALDLRNPASAN